MSNRLFVIIVIMCGLFLIESCQNSTLGPEMVDTSGIYAYKTFDSNGSVSDSGILLIKQTDSTIGGEIHTNIFSFAILGKINDTGYVQFTEKPEKIPSYFWYGSDKGVAITGNFEVITGGRATPLLKQRFVATRLVN